MHPLSSLGVGVKNFRKVFGGGLEIFILVGGQGLVLLGGITEF